VALSGIGAGGSGSVVGWSGAGGRGSGTRGSEDQQLKPRGAAVSSEATHGGSPSQDGGRGSRTQGSEIPGSHGFGKPELVPEAIPSLTERVHVGGIPHVD